MTIDFAKTDYNLDEISAELSIHFDCSLDEIKEAIKNLPLKENTLLASGPENEKLEKEFAEYVGAKFAVCVNSGSSANLLALASLKIPKLAIGRRVLTSACGFPATLNPILHLGLEPVLVDYSLETFNISINTKINYGINAIILAHTLGNKVDLSWYDGSVPLIEDCCEAVGSKGVGQTGTLATWSFYPAHQMTALGGGGMVTTNREDLYLRMKSLRDWGKTATWDSGRGGNSTTYDSSIGYHMGYTYDTVGWNFKLPEANCAFGREQIKKLDSFREIRMKNWKYLRDGLKDIPRLVISPMHEGASPFGLCMMVQNRNEFGAYLESKGIKHRPFFAGNILRQPAFKSPDAEKFPVADTLMTHALFIGCHTKLTKEDLNYMIETIHAFPGHTEF